MHGQWKKEAISNPKPPDWLIPFPSAWHTLKDYEVLRNDVTREACVSQVPYRGSFHYRKDIASWIVSCGHFIALISMIWSSITQNLKAWPTVNWVKVLMFQWIPLKVMTKLKLCRCDREKCVRHTVCQWYFKIALTDCILREGHLCINDTNLHTQKTILKFGHFYFKISEWKEKRILICTLCTLLNV
jgi:hypothetical protein